MFLSLTRSEIVIYVFVGSSYRLLVTITLVLCIHHQHSDYKMLICIERTHLFTVSDSDKWFLINQKNHLI